MVAGSEDQVFITQRELLAHLQGNKFVAEILNQWPVDAISRGAVPFLQNLFDCLPLPDTKIILYTARLMIRMKESLMLNCR